MSNPFRMKILITGAGGFIGGHLVEALSHDYDVIGVDIKETDNWKIDASKCGGFKAIQGDVALPSTAEYAILESRPDVILHLAGIPIPKEYLHNPREVIHATLESGLTLINKIAEIKMGAKIQLGRLGAEVCKRFASWDPYFIFTSTSEIYGKNDDYDEDTSLRIYGSFKSRRWCYAISKAMIEELLAASDLNWIILRIFNIVGPRIDRWGQGRVLTKMIGSAFLEGTIKVTGHGKQIRSLTHIDDFVKGMQELLSKIRSRIEDHVPLQTEKEVINFGNPANAISMLDLAAEVATAVKKHTGRDISIKLVMPNDFFKGKNDEIEKRIPDTTKWNLLFETRPYTRNAYIIDELVALAKDFFGNQTNEEE